MQTPFDENSLSCISFNILFWWDASVFPLISIGYLYVNWHWDIDIQQKTYALLEISRLSLKTDMVLFFIRSAYNRLSNQDREGSKSNQRGSIITALHATARIKD